MQFAPIKKLCKVSDIIMAFYEGSLLQVTSWYVLGKVRQTNEFGRTLLHMASSQGSTHLVKGILAKEGVDVNKADTSGRTPLFYAASYGHHKVVKALLRKEGIQVNKAVNDVDGYTPLLKAVMSGHTKVIELLLAKEGVDVNQASKSGVMGDYKVKLLSEIIY